MKPPFFYYYALMFFKKPLTNHTNHQEVFIYNHKRKGATTQAAPFLIYIGYSNYTPNDFLTASIFSRAAALASA